MESLVSFSSISRFIKNICSTNEYSVLNSTFNSSLLLPFVSTFIFVLVLFMTKTLILMKCCCCCCRKSKKKKMRKKKKGKKEKNRRKSRKIESEYSNRDNLDEMNMYGFEGGFNYNYKPPSSPKVPTFGGLVSTKDPNYQTLAAIGPDVFAQDKGGGIFPGLGGKPIASPAIPLYHGMVGTDDPNYQTLAALGPDVFGVDKSAEGGGLGASKGDMVGTQDPNYQTLAALGPDVFEQKGGGGAIAAPGPFGMANSQDPNYQTLAGVDDYFMK